MDVLKFFNTFRPVVAEQVIEVPKIVPEDSIPQRTALRELQLVEQSVEVPTEPAFVEQTVDTPVPGGGGGPLHLRGFFPEQSSTACGGGGLRGFLPGQGSTASSSVSRSPTAALNDADEPFDGVFALECGGGCALELIHAERSSMAPHENEPVTTWVDDNGDAWTLVPSSLSVCWLNLHTTHTQWQSPWERRSWRCLRISSLSVALQHLDMVVGGPVGLVDHGGYGTIPHVSCAKA